MAETTGRDRFFGVYLSTTSAPSWPPGPLEPREADEVDSPGGAIDDPIYSLHAHVRARDLDHAMQKAKELADKGVIPREFAPVFRNLSFFRDCGLEHFTFTSDSYNFLLVRSSPHLMLLLPGRIRMLELPLDADTLTRFYDLAVRDSSDVLAVAIVDMYDPQRRKIEQYSTSKWSLADIMFGSPHNPDVFIHNGREYPGWFKQVIEFGE